MLAQPSSQAELTNPKPALVRSLLHLSPVKVEKETNMRKNFIAALLVASMAVPFVIGCDRTLHQDEKTTTSPNGSQSSTETKTVQHPDGSVTTEKNTSHNTNPNQ